MLIVLKMWKKSFKIDLNFYSGEIIEQGIADFSDFDIEYLRGELYISSDGDHEKIYNEFMNYLVYLNVSQKWLTMKK